MKLGKAQYEKKARKKYFGVKDGDQAYRILPPMGDLADKGVWARYYSVHYGYLNSEKKMKPFVSPEFRNPKTKIIEIRDAAKERLKEAEAALETAKKAGQTKIVQALEEFLDNYNLDSHWYMNAINSDGEIGLLKIRHKAKLSLDAQIKKLKSEGVDPLSVEDGRFFVFSRTGTGRDTVYQVSVLKKKENIPGVGNVEREVIHALDESIIARLDSEAFNLDTIFAKPSEEEVDAIVAGDKAKNYEAIDAILGVYTTNEESSADSEEDENAAAAAQEEEQAPVEAAPAPAPEPVKEAVKAASPEASKPRTVKPADLRSEAEILAELGL